MVTTAMAAQLRALARMKNLRRKAGPEGELKRKTVNESFTYHLDGECREWSPFSSTMVVQYDGLEE